MSDTQKPEATSAAAPPTTITIKDHGKERTFDLTKPEDVETLRTRYQLGGIVEQERTKRAELEQELARIRPDAEQAQAIKTFAAASPVGAAVVKDIITGVSQGALDPARVRSLVFSAEQGGSEAVQAQAQAASNPQERALLHAMATQLQRVEANQAKLESAQAERDREAQIAATLTNDAFFKARPALADAVARRTRELVKQGGVPLDLAASQAKQEIRELLDESATAERNQLREQEKLRTTAPTEGLPPVSKLAADARAKIDPKAPPAVQQEQKRLALRDYFGRLEQRIRGSNA